MSGNDSVHREACRRFHRVMAHYLAVYAWKNGADCIVIERHTIESTFHISRITASRREWFEEDMKPWFPYIEISNYSGTFDKFAAIYLSRRDLPTRPGGRTVRQTAEFYTDKGVCSVYFELDNEKIGASFEKYILSSMALLASGLVPISEVIDT